MIALLAEAADVRKLRKTRFIKDGALDVESLLRRSELLYLYLKTRYVGTATPSQSTWQKTRTTKARKTIDGR